MSTPAVIQTKSVAVGELGFDPKNAAELMQMAKFIADSALKPAELKTAADVFLVMAVGMSWGFDPMMALQTLHVVKGRVGLPGETCAALVQSHPLCQDYRTGFDGEGDERVAWVSTWRKGRERANDRVTFSMADAKRAGLTGGDNWRKYPDDMLLWKAVARDKRRNWPDVYPGLQVREDIEHLPRVVRDVTPLEPEADPLLVDVIEAELTAPSESSEGPATIERATVSAGADGAVSSTGHASPWNADGCCSMCDRHEAVVRESGHAKGCHWEVPA